jgi:hypothetical protein
MSDGDRRAPGATRIPFEAMVEVGGAVGPAFEAQAVDVSPGGMHLRTAYLPELGQPLTCRFDAGPNQTVLASGEVVWAEEANRGGEFGIRFSNLDPESARALATITMSSQGSIEAPRAAGAKVRLHIDGLGSPMRARVKGSNRAELTVGSELGFLQVGKELELENAETGAKRPARIDRVEVQIDPQSHVPQLVVALRYSDTMEAVAPVGDEAREDTPGPTTANADRESLEVEVVDPDAAEMAAMQSGADRMKGALARKAAQVAPAIDALAKRAKVTMALLAAKAWRARGEAKDDVGIPARRVTAPPPTGGLHAEGRKVVRDSMADSVEAGTGKMKSFTVDRKKMIVGGTIGIGVILAAMAMRTPNAPPPTAAKAENDAPMAAGIAPAATTTAVPVATGVSEPIPVNTAAVDPSAGGAAFGRSGASVTDAPPTVYGGGEEHHAAAKRVHVAPFANGAVTHGNILRLKMDGMIEKIQGAQQPTGFTVVVPTRKSLEAAGPLAARDARIASIKVTNDSAGAELSVAFKDGVPNYQVRAKGDVLEIVLAPMGRIADNKAVSAPANAANKRKPVARRH